MYAFPGPANALPLLCVVAGLSVLRLALLYVAYRQALTRVRGDAARVSLFRLFTGALRSGRWGKALPGENGGRADGGSPGDVRIRSDPPRDPDQLKAARSPARRVVSPRPPPTARRR